MDGDSPRSSRFQINRMFVLTFILTLGAVSYFASQTKTQIPIPVKFRASNNSLVSHSLTDLLESKNYLYHGFVLGLSFYDQQTSALRRLLSLQCWADELGVSVVEPFVIGTKLEVPLSMNSSLLQQQIKFSDAFDVHYWDPPLVRWEEFLHRAPRDVIFVHITYDQRNCTSDIVEYYRNYMTVFFVQHGFAVVSAVCICQHCVGDLSTKQFNSLVFGKFAPNKVTVIFDGWRGIAKKGPHIIGISDSTCGTQVTLATSVAPSEKISIDARTYVSQCLLGEPYIAVMVRLERVIRSQSGSDPEAVGVHLKRVTDAWQRMKEKSHLNNTFVAVDVGKFGSAGFKKFEKQWMKYNIMKHVDHFIKTIYGNSTTIEEWEQTFVNVSGTTKPGYIGMLQKTITANATCILLAGTGTFQRHTQNLYKRLHSKAQCLDILGQL